MRYWKPLKHLLLFYLALTLFYIGRFAQRKSWEVDQRLKISKGDFELVEKE